jgi:flagellar biosynthesis chaperone FliJ
VKRFVNRLDAVLRIRRAAEQQAREALALANGALAAATNARSERAAHYRAVTAQSSSADNGAGFLAELQSTALASAGLRTADGRVNAAIERVALAQIAWKEAARQVTVLERLRDRRLQEWRLEVERAEAREVDDIVTARYAARLAEAAQ